MWQQESDSATRENDNKLNCLSYTRDSNSLSYYENDKQNTRIPRVPTNGHVIFSYTEHQNHESQKKKKNTLYVISVNIDASVNPKELSPFKM